MAGTWEDVDQTADRFQVSKWTLYKLVKAGLPCVKVGTQLRFDPEEVDTYFRRQRGTQANPVEVSHA